MARLRLVVSDITGLRVDAVVNAANHSLLGGGGVDGAIHRAAGPGLLQECMALGGCGVGDAKVTSGHGLPAGMVVHAVGPVWRGGDHGEAGLLASCYRRSLELADEKGARSVAFPCIGTGAFGYPLREAAEVAVRTVMDHLEDTGSDIEVTFCCFTEAAAVVYRSVLSSAGALFRDSEGV